MYFEFIKNYLFLNQRKSLDLWEKDSAVSLELLDHLGGAWGSHTGHAERKKNLRCISLLEEGMEICGLIASNRDLLGLPRSGLGSE